MSAKTIALIRVESGKGEPSRFRYYEFILVAYVVVLLCSNLIGPGKSCRIAVFGFPLVFGAGNLFFPVSYIIDDVLTEVYGYARARRATWAGFGALIFAMVMSLTVIHLPPDAAEPFNQKLQPAMELVFGNTPRIFLASVLAFWVGDFANAFVMAKMKIWTDGKRLWTRTIGSIAFIGLWNARTVFQVIAFNWIMKVFVEVVATPLTYLVIRRLKQAEGIDFYDRGTDFNPFTIRT